MAFSQAAALQAQLQYGSVPQDPPFRDRFLQQMSPQTAAPSCPPAPPLDPLCGLGLLLERLTMGCSSFTSQPLVHCGLLHSCMWTSALHGTPGLQEDTLFLHGPLLGCRELLFCTWSNPCLLLHRLRDLQDCFSHIFSLRADASSIFLFLKQSIS